MARTNGPIQVWHRTDTIPTDAEGGYAGGDSTAAAVGGAQAAATQAVATVDNLSATATALPPGASPTVTVTGPVPNKVINIGIPRGADGADGMGYEEGQQLLNQNADTLAAAQTAATDTADAIRTNLVTDISTPGSPAYEALVDVAGDITDPATAGLIGDPDSQTRGALDTLLEGVAVDDSDVAGLIAATDSSTRAALDALLGEADPGITATTVDGVVTLTWTGD